ncbi:MAG: LysR family transcriptional regulator [Caulobacteraceae bacterium]
MLNEMKVFVRAVELKSISAAARNLRLSAAAASHRILQLEEHVGVRLLNRTTRSLQPTEAGCIFYEHALNVLEAVERAESSMAMASGVPTGQLRVAAPLGFGRRILAPLVSEFHALHPKVEMRLRLSDHAVDILSESVDVAIRMSALPDSSFISRKLADCPRVLCAAPSYLEKHGAPQRPEDLLNHNCLLLRFPRLDRVPLDPGNAGRSADPACVGQVRRRRRRRPDRMDAAGRGHHAEALLGGGRPPSPGPAAGGAARLPARTRQLGDALSAPPSAAGQGAGVRRLPDREVAPADPASAGNRRQGRSLRPQDFRASGRRRRCADRWPLPGRHPGGGRPRLRGPW